MRAVVLLLLLLFITACAVNGLVTEDRKTMVVQGWTIHAAAPAEPGPVQLDAYVEMSRCSEAIRRPDAPLPHQIRWIQADSIIPPGAYTRKPRGVSLSPGNRIVIVRTAWYEFDLSAHEILHQLTPNDISHGHPAFQRCDPLFPYTRNPEG